MSIISMSTDTKLGQYEMRPGACRPLRLTHKNSLFEHRCLYSFFSPHIVIFYLSQYDNLPQVSLTRVKEQRGTRLIHTYILKTTSAITMEIYTRAFKRHGLPHLEL